MSHVDDGTLNALLDGELEAAEAAAVRAHLAECADCARRLDEARRFLDGANDLLGALDLPASVNAPPAPARRVPKTAREVAVDLDGATQKSPAIRPNLPEAAPPAPVARPRFDYSALSWAAIIVLALGVGYLASEVFHTRRGGAAGGAAPRPGVAAEPSAPPAQAQGRALAPKTGRASPGARSGGHAPATAHAPVTHPPQPAGGVPESPASAKRVAAANAPSAGRQAARLADANAVAAAPPAGARAQEVAAAPEVSRLAAGAPAGASVTGVAAPVRPLSTFRRVTLEEAVARLNGVIRLMDGMRFQQVEVGPGTLVAGADRERDVVRLVYVDSAGRRLVLDQQRVTPPEGGGVVSSDIGMRAGDVLTTATPDGGVRVRWIDGPFWLSLTGNLPPEQLQRLTERVR